MADILQQMLKQAYQSRPLVHPLHQGAQLTVLQSADDMLLILHSSAEQATYAKKILDTTAKFSGLQIIF
jgi:hypothetical protein